MIIEPHRDVLAYMRKTGWYDIPGVTILEGKWQDFISSEEIYAVGGFDIIYTDTFSESYSGAPVGVILLACRRLTVHDPRRFA